MRPAWRKTIAALEVVGGVCGPLAIAFELARGRPGPDELARAAVLVAAYLLALAAGVLLWYGTRTGRVLSVVAQLVQLPKLMSPKLTFAVSYGLDFYPMAVSAPGPVGRRGLVFEVRVLAQYQFLADAGGLPTGIGFSLASILALWLLLRRGPAAAPAASVPTPPAPTPSDGQPNWVPSFGLVLIVGLLLGVFAVCAGAALLLR
jgi:heme/copper-type cytochrome/quinol oxidase subunit 1